MKLLRSRISHEYNLTRWMIHIFLGGIINTMLIKSSIEHYRPENLILLCVIIFFSPIILSFILTRFTPEKRIVPPLYFQFIATGWFLVFGHDPYWSLIQSAIYSWGFAQTFIILGIVQDEVVKKILGLGANRNDIYNISLRANESLEKIKEIVVIESLRKNLEIERMEGGEQRPRFRSHKWARYPFIMELTSINGNETIINVVAFDRRRYNITRTEDVDEFVRSKIDYLTGILSRSNITLVKTIPDHAQHLINFILDEMMGLSIHAKKISRLSWIQMLVALGTLAIPLSVLLGKIEFIDTNTAYILLVSIILTIIFSIPRFFHK